MTFAFASEQVDTALDSLLRKVAFVDDFALSPALPQLGQVIGDKYRVESQLGRGGMGAVFRAAHVLSQKPVALKWMLRSPADERARARFLREAHVAGRIDHPNVVDVYDVGREGRAYYLVMELLRGETLRARIDRGPLFFQEALRLLLPAMRGVAAVHRAGVVHRDLKPDNIFLCQSPDGTPREAKVLDFGISAVSVRDAQEDTLTEEGAILGTPAYMSPEQLHGQRDINTRADVYAFGVILYEALAGTLPVVADSYAALVLAAAEHRPTPLRERRSEIPQGLERVVMRALAKRREDRHPSMDELIAALVPFMAQPIARHAHVTTRVRERKPAARRALTLALALTGLLIAFGLSHGFGKGLRPGRVRADQTPSAALEVLPETPAQQTVLATAVVSAQPTCDPAELQPTAAVGAAPPASSLNRARPTSRSAPAHRLVNARIPSKTAPPALGELAEVAACDPPYSVDAAGRIIFKPECI